MYTCRKYMVPMVTKVELTKAAKKDLRKVPDYVEQKLFRWVDDVRNDGLEEVRKIPGWHDEALQGQRKHQRSIRLSRAYRAIYELREDPEADSKVEFVEVQEVNKHDY
jgi:proteic killer suppression protein